MWRRRGLDLSAIAGAASAETGERLASEPQADVRWQRERRYRRRLLWAVSGSCVLHLLVVVLFQRYALFDAAPPPETTPLKVYLAVLPQAGTQAAPATPQAEAPALAQAESPQASEIAAPGAAASAEPDRPAPNTEAESRNEPELAPPEPQVPAPSGGTTDAPEAPTETLTEALLAAGAELNTGAGFPTAAQAALERLPLDPDLERKLERRIRKQLEKSDEASIKSLTVRHDGQKYTIRLQRFAAADASSFEQAVAEISTTREGEELAATMEFERLAFSRFAQFVDDWDRGLMLSLDEIHGRFHVNSEINILCLRDQEPRLTGRVSVASVNFEGNGRRSLVFKGGLETRAQRIAMPRSVAAPPVDGQADIHRVDADAAIEFLADGGYTISGSDGMQTETRARDPALPLFIVAGERAGIDIRGTVRGVVVVYSPRRVGIVGSVRYATDPREQPASPDYLGIVSANIVEVGRPEFTGPGNIEIFAAVYAARRFVVRRAMAGGAALLHVYGSLAAGSISATEPRFATRFEFDPRFERSRLPHFPMSSRFERNGATSGWLAVNTTEEVSPALGGSAQSLP